MIKRLCIIIAMSISIMNTVYATKWSDEPDSTYNLDCTDVNIGNDKALMSIVNSESFSEILVSKPKPNIQKMVGQISNPFGISNCLMAVVVKNIPANNKNATVAAIKKSQFDQKQLFIYDENDLTNLANKSAAASICIRYYLNDDKTYKQFEIDYKGLLLTPELRHAWNRAQMKISGNAIAPDFGTSDSLADYGKLCGYFIYH